ncbi:class I SAM-dependent methyltransferase [Chloroflexota bacterium]
MRCKRVMSIVEKSNIERFKKQVLGEWTNLAVAAAYRRWGYHEVVTFQGLTEVIVKAAQLKPNMKVIDLASGSGEPAFALAKVVGQGGHVTATDLGAELIAIAEESAQEQGLTNMSFCQADAHALPFPDQTFDRVTARLGVTYFADSEQALSECHRVLKPDGRVIFIVWGPPLKQGFMTSTIRILMKYVKMPEDEPGAPTPFRFAEAGTLSAALQTVGFKQVKEEYISIDAHFPGSPEEFWQYFVDMAPPFRPVIDTLQSDQRELAIEEVLATLRQMYDGQYVNIPTVVVLASGVR